MFPQRMPCGSSTCSSSSGNSSLSSMYQDSPMIELFELEMNDLEDTKWDLRCAKCKECNELVPHRLLFICQYHRCDGFYEPKKDHEVPAEFYKNENVFCSKCAFTGSHKHHIEDIEEAHPVAVAMALKGEDNLTVSFTQLAFLNHEEPVDFLIANEIELTGLPVLPIEECLFGSLDSYDFQIKKTNFDVLKKTVEQCRVDGAKYAKGCAEKTLVAYHELAKDVEEIIKEHEISNNGEKIRERKDSGTTESTISFQSENEESQILENTSISPAETVVDKQQQESFFNFSSTSNEVDETTAKMICSNLNLRYDLIRDDMLIEAALQDVSDKLHEFSGSIENKLAAARMFKEKNNVALYYP
ncbi:hypothetical protein GCK72_019163 [Caenorhabditis remanei]|uniref:Uncharacterized protein n=1 Tax=Caenorhabditis remanei TaxID=31234 RepID=A0A6A5GBW9_CAERE|nr:hypothetical protein GCK72_019163 [Caenorhabditis remanei]KAF1752608.1 hypothetical protein GCK72_019163 [Caenorhabditis remanei]